MRAILAPLLLGLALSACGAPADEGTVAEEGALAGDPAGLPEATSLLGTPLYPRSFTPEAREGLERNLAEAQARFESAPEDVESHIWLGRRLAYLERYREAIDAFGAGIAAHPEDARLYRHRGHRYLTVRDFPRAVEDLERAASLVEGQPDEVEPDGAPNRFNIPTSTLQSNIWYHLGLAYYLQEDWENALRAYREAMKVSKNDDMRVATSDWLYMTLRRMGRDEEARAVLEPIRAEMEILENESYLRRLLMYKGEMTPEELLEPEGADDLTLATQGYGVGNWYLYNGEPDRAREVFQRVLDGNYWAAFGYIASEAEMARDRQ